MEYNELTTENAKNAYFSVFFVLFAVHGSL